MAAAAILNAASVSSATGGTFADTLTINTGGGATDSFTIPTTNTGYGDLIALWAADSAHAAEFEVYATRTDSFHDTNTGLRWAVPVNTLGATGLVSGAWTAFRRNRNIPVFSGDTLTMKASCTASDAIAAAWLTLYQDLPGVDNPQFTTIERVQQLRKSDFAFSQLPVASSTAGSWGATRALTADDNRFSADTYYALLGFTARIPTVAVSLVSTLWGGQRIGAPSGLLDFNTADIFVSLSKDHGVPLIPYFKQQDAANINVSIMDVVASTSPKIDWNVVELTGAP